MSLLVQTPSPRILTTGNLTTNPPDKEPTHLYVRFQTLNISANPTPAMSPPTTKDDPSSPSESKPAPDMESPATSGSIVPKTITPVDIKVEGGVEEKESAGESGGDGDTREVKVEVDWGKAKASEGRGKAEGKVGEVCDEGPRGPPENDSSWDFGGLEEKKKWEEARRWDLFAFMSWRMGWWPDYGKGSAEPDGMSE